MDVEKKIKEKGSTSGGTMDLQALPEECMANILSYTTPVDACRLSSVSTTFCSAAESDAVWDRFLPSDLNSIISRFDSSSSLLATSSSKKALYLTLSDHPIIIDQGKKSFQLDRKSGKKCYMLAARDLGIIWGGTPQYWNWRTLPESRFEEVAELLAVCWFEIRGKINTLALSPNTQYAAYLVFKMIDARGFRYCPVELSVGIFGGHSCTKNACLDPNIEERQVHGSLQRPNVRNDGWLEIEMGEFFNSGLEDDEMQLSVMETKTNLWKHGFFLEGIEVRPKVSACEREVIRVRPNEDGRHLPARGRGRGRGRVLRNWGEKLKMIWNRH